MRKGHGFILAPEEGWPGRAYVRPMNSNSLAIHTRGLGKRFGERAALDGIDLEVPRGVAFGFLGAHGAGKTTLIRLLLGLAEPTAGSMRVLGHDVRTDRAAALARVGAIIEEPRFHRPLSGRENLHVNAAARDRAAHGRVDAALERVGLGARADDKVGTYSLGAPPPRGAPPALAPRPGGAAPGGADERARPGRHPRVPPPHPRPRRRGPHR